VEIRNSIEMGMSQIGNGNGNEMECTRKPGNRAEKSSPLLVCNERTAQETR